MTTDISDMNPELRRTKSMEYYMKVSGEYVDVNDAFRVWDSINRGLHQAGLDRSLKVGIYSRYAFQTADKGRLKENKLVQLLTPPQVNILPGAGTLGDKEEEKIGALKRLVSFVRGTKEEGSSK